MDTPHDHPILGIIFDFDGTLVNSLPDIAQAMNEVLQRHGFSTHAMEDYKVKIGDGVQKLVERSLPPEHREDEQIDTCLTEMKLEYEKRCTNTSNVYEGIHDLLSILVNRSMKMAVLSNKLTKLTRHMADHYFPGVPFDPVAGQEPSVPLKPDPTGALAIARDWQIEPENIFFLGDTATDMQTATAAGMIAIGATWGFRPREELLEHGAHALVDHPGQVLNLWDDPPSP